MLSNFHRNYVNVKKKINKNIVIAILAKDKEYCLKFYLECIYNLNYNKKNIHLYIRSNDNKDETQKILENFIKKHEKEYGSIYSNFESVNDRLKEMGHREWNKERFKILGSIRHESIQYAIKKKCHYFVVDCDNFITSNCLKILVEKIYQYKVLAPMLNSQVRKKWYSNFFYEITDKGYCKVSNYYYTILNRQHKGIFKVPLIHCTYMINNDILSEISYDDGSNRYEYAIFSDVLRKKNIHQYLINEDFYGYILWSLTEDELKEDLNNWKHHFKGNNYIKINLEI